jgi:anthranilate synthase component II
MLTVIDNYDSFTYNLVQFLGDLGHDCRVIRNDDMSAKEVLALNSKAIILSPGPCTPNEAGICLELVEMASHDLPILGVCLGHQTIGQAFGGHIIRAPEIMHGKVASIDHDKTNLFQNIPSPVRVTRYHSLIVEKSTLPDHLHITAQTQDGIIMGLSHRQRPVHGVQFHPESIATEEGHRILANFLHLADLEVNESAFAFEGLKI